MSFKQFIPSIEDEWDSYWRKTSVEEEIARVETDGLKPIFMMYLPKNGRILEAGCGLGKWIITLSEEGYHIEGVDTNRYALKKLKRYFPKAKVKIADVRSLPFADETFDAYLSLGVAEHFEEGPQQALKEAHRVLKKGGNAYIEVPFDSPLRRLTRVLTRIILVSKTPPRLLLELLGIRNKRRPVGRRFYEYRYTTSELQKIVKKAGFKMVKIFPKDDLSEHRSIALWSDYPKLHKVGGKMFELNRWGIRLRRILNAISPFSYSALILAVAKKPV